MWGAKEGCRVDMGELFRMRTFPSHAWVQLCGSRAVGLSRYWGLETDVSIATGLGGGIALSGAT